VIVDIMLWLGYMLEIPFRFPYTDCMKIRKGMSIQTDEGEFVIRHINRSIKPALVMLTEKYKPRFGKKIYIRENCFQYTSV